MKWFDQPLVRKGHRGGMPGKGGNSECVDSPSIMAKTAICPRCKAGNEPHARFCRSCGKVFFPCPQCGCLETDAVMFCPDCGKMLSSGREQDDTDTDSGEKPYVVWQRWPFAWMEKRMQTRRQFLVVIILSVTLGSLFLVAWGLDMILSEGRSIGGTTCFISLIATFWILWILLSWKAGLEGAREENRRRKRP